MPALHLIRNLAVEVLIEDVLHCNGKPVLNHY